MNPFNFAKKPIASLIEIVVFYAILFLVERLTIYMLLLWKLREILLFSKFTATSN